MKDKKYRLGIDAGSTTIKVVLLDEAKKIIHKAYRRHKSNIQGTFIDEISQIKKKFGEITVKVCVTGSAGIGIAERIGTNFIQEVVASVGLVQKQFSHIRTLFDLGGEDAKMVFFSDNKHPDIRMNGSCAGGTGAFIDQMASLMNIPIEELGSYAEKHNKIYTIASRCGVFAKTDIQNLISRNVPIEDISASTLYAVALQSITTLARGCDILPPVLCVGGPLTFVPALRNAFCENLNLNKEDLVVPENGEYFPAWGAALHIEDDFKEIGVSDIIERLNSRSRRVDTESLQRLFEDETDYQKWRKSRNVKTLDFREFVEGETIDCFIGIDSGSTTTKVVVLDENANILFYFYDSNDGNSLRKVTECLDLFYKKAEKKNVNIRVVSSAVTGYGEDLIKSALNADYGIVETMAHLSGAQFVDANVSFVLDIGGQDIKSLFVENGVVSNIELNEACSAGCGSFLQNFASTMNIGLEEFTEKACLARNPSDLGSRCTVFMNSKVKQSLRENAGVDDIASGLAYSVVKNCLYKVLKISNLNKLGDNIVVQGGTFKNDAVYRALELLSGKSVSSTNHPELMGAFGAALYARKQWEQERKESSFIGKDAITSMDCVEASELNCKGCTNSCSILKFKFNTGNICYAGNKCEKIFYNSSKSKEVGYNAFDRKNEILFDFPLVDSNKETVGIPRVLNMFENYPFWYSLFTGCGYNVVLSQESNSKLYQKGVGSVMSDNICFPAKLVHGHILDLVDKRVDWIFYPLVPKEEKEFGNASNSWNCPVVSGYPDVIKSSIDTEKNYRISFNAPIIGFNSNEVLKDTCWNYFQTLNVDKKVFLDAFHRALEMRAKVKEDLKSYQKSLLDEALENNRTVFIVTGRPYHTDPLIHQKTGQILADLGVVVLTDDVFRENSQEGFGKLNIVSQWSYPNRVIQSALNVAALPHNVQMIQLNSFGCGPDSFFMDEAANILKTVGKNLTVVRIDEIASPGSVRLRLRSLLESLIHNKPTGSTTVEYSGYNVPFTKNDRKKTILVPWLADFASPFIPAYGELAGYNFVTLPRPDKFSAEVGLKYGNNEVCYPSTLVLGDILKALQSGKYDLKNTAVTITQTGGQCRATNYIAQIKTGLERAGFTDIPIVVLAAGETYQNSQEGFKIPWLKLADIVVYSLLYGDSLQQMLSSISAREKQKGEARRHFDFYMELGCDAVRKNSHKLLLDYLHQAVGDFNNIPIYEKDFTKIGLIGEIYVKYNSYAQAYISDWLRERGMEVVTPPIIDFAMQYFVNSKINVDNKINKKSRLIQMFSPLMWKFMNSRIKATEAVMKDFRFYEPSVSIYVKAQYASEILSLSNQFGEGWSIAAEAAHYAHLGVDRVVCVQPFGCIANHVVAKGIEKRLKSVYPQMNLLYLDIDSGVAEVNLHNRLHFMIE